MAITPQPPPHAPLVSPPPDGTDPGNPTNPPNAPSTPSTLDTTFSPRSFFERTFDLETIKQKMTFSPPEELSLNHWKSRIQQSGGSDDAIIHSLRQKKMTLLMAKVKGIAYTLLGVAAAITTLTVGVASLITLGPVGVAPALGCFLATFHLFYATGVNTVSRYQYLQQLDREFEADEGFRNLERSYPDAHIDGSAVLDYFKSLIPFIN